MNSRNLKLEAHALQPDHDDDAISSVRRVPFLDRDLGIEIELFAEDRAFEDPTPVYATPFAVVDGHRCDFTRRYCLGTRFELGVIASATWEDELRAGGGSDRMIAACRRFLDDNAL